MTWVGPRQRLLIERAVGSGAVRVTTRSEKNSALHAHDRGLLRRGIDGETYHPTTTAIEKVRQWQDPGTWKTLSAGAPEPTPDTTTPPTGSRP